MHLLAFFTPLGLWDFRDSLLLRPGLEAQQQGEGDLGELSSDRVSPGLGELAVMAEPGTESGQRGVELASGKEWSDVSVADSGRQQTAAPLGVRHDSVAHGMLDRVRPVYRGAHFATRVVGRKHTRIGQ